MVGPNLVLPPCLFSVVDFSIEEARVGEAFPMSVLKLGEEEPGNPEKRWRVSRTYFQHL